MTYFDLNLNLSDEDKAIREAAHKFAKEVMRPMGIELDRMSAEETVAAEFADLGLPETGLRAWLPQSGFSRGSGWSGIHPFPEPPHDGRALLGKYRPGSDASPGYMALRQDPAHHGHGTHRGIRDSLLPVHGCFHHGMLGRHRAGPWLGHVEPGRGFLDGPEDQDADQRQAGR